MENLAAAEFDGAGELEGLAAGVGDGSADAAGVGLGGAGSSDAANGCVVPAGCAAVGAEVCRVAGAVPAGVDAQAVATATTHVRARTFVRRMTALRLTATC